MNLNKSRFLEKNFNKKYVFLYTHLMILCYNKNGDSMKKLKAVNKVLLIFSIVLMVHIFEALFLRLDETVLAENFVNKIFGIIVIFCVLVLCKWKWTDIGFSKKGFLKYTLIGIALATLTFVISYAVEIIILTSQGHSVRIDIFTTSFSLVGETQINNGIGFILLCVFFNIINVVMEEGLFRGLFTKITSTEKSMKYALILQSVLFGIWHIVTPLKDLVDGSLGFSGFIVLSIGYLILAGLMGIKWGLLYRMTGNLYVGMADHFFNNCIASNLLHICTESGIDEMMIIRIAIAQLISFVFVVIMYAKWNKKKAK